MDRLLDAKARAKLRAISSRAHITASSFVNSYDWGDLKADPLSLLERYFDLFLYVANWGTRWFAVKLPKRVLDLATMQERDPDEDVFALRPAGEHVMLSITRNELDTEDWDDGTGWLAALAPLRGELLAGDLRLFSLLWLIQVENESIADDMVEPPPGIGSLSPSLAALAEFLCIDGDLLEAAVGPAPAQVPAEPSQSEVESFVRGLPDDEKTALLLRCCSGDAHVGAELRRRSYAPSRQPPQAALRTAGELRAGARRIDAERRRRAKEKAAAEQRRREQEAARAQAKRLAALAGREEGAWREVEDLIALRNASGYEQATALLGDLGELAARNNAREAFARQLAAVRARHGSKRTFIARLDAAGLPGQ